LEEKIGKPLGKEGFEEMAFVTQGAVFGASVKSFERFSLVFVGES
jgi:hypothetical protein